MTRERERLRGRLFLVILAALFVLGVMVINGLVFRTGPWWAYLGIALVAMTAAGFLVVVAFRTGRRLRQLWEESQRSA